MSVMRGESRGGNRQGREICVYLRAGLTPPRLSSLRKRGGEDY